MTQDMGNNISYCSKALAREMARSKQALDKLMSMLRACLQIAAPHSDQWSENVFVRKERTLSPSRTNSQSVGHVLRIIHYAAMLLLMMVVGVSEMWGHPFTLTTDDDVTNHTETLYWIESKGATGFFAIPHTDDTRLSTSNMPNERMLWYFMDANTEEDTENGKQYYYIVNKSTGKYMKLAGDLGVANSIQIATFSASDTEENKDKFRFVIVSNSGAWVLHPKSAYDNDNSKYTHWVNKDKSNVGYNTNETTGWFKASNYNNTIDDNSRWYFRERNNVTWAHPFTNSTNSEKHYYTIHNATANGAAYYMSTDDDSDPYATISSDVNDDKKVWYFVEAASDNTIPNFKYFYIVNAVTGKYLKFTKTANGNLQTNSLQLYNHTGSETEETENRFQFMILNAKGNTYSAYSIMPKLEISYYDNKYTSLSPGTSSGNTYSGNNAITLTNDMKIGTYRDRGQNDNYAHWTFEPIDPCADPVIGFDLETKKVILSSTTTGSSIYYTMEEGSEPTDPTRASTLYDNGITLTENASTTIKAVTVKNGNARSNVVSKTIIYMPTITLSGGPYTYDGNAKTPSISVTVGETPVSADDYDISYENNTNAGTATVTIREKTNNASIIYGTTTFTIAKADINPTLSITGWTYGTPNDPSVSGNTGNGTVTYLYKVKGAGDDTYSNEKPTDAGTYLVKAVIAESTNYNGATIDPVEFTISKATFNPTVSITGWAYGETANSPSVSDVPGSVTVTYKYKVQGADDDTYTDVVPTNVGTYTVKATIAETSNYNAASATADFLISKANINPTVSITGWTYGGTANSPSVDVNPGSGAVTYKYKVQGANDDTYSTDVPTNAGDYTVQATIAETDNYNGKTVTADFTISKASFTPTVSLADWIYGSTAATPAVSGNPSDGMVTYSYKVKDADNDTYTDVVPTNAGDYTVKVSIAATTNYNAASATTDFTISKASLSATVSIDGWTYGETVATPSVTGNTGNGAVTYTYKVKGADDKTYSTTVPTNAGDYTVKASIAATTNYSAASVTTDFTISKASLSATVSIDGWTYGETAATPSVTGNTGNGAVTYTYKVKGADDNTYSTTVPTNAGDYTVKASIATTTNYSAGEATADFTIAIKIIGDDINPTENITIEITDADHVSVKQGGKELRVGTEGTDYDYSISTTGGASDKYFVVTVTGANNYTGSFTTKFANVTFGTKNNNYYWGTFVSNDEDGDFAVPSNMEAYIVTGINASAGTVEVEGPLDNIPEQEPVLLLTNKNAHGFIVKTKDGGTTPTGTNHLEEATGNDDDRTFNTAEIYLLYKGEFVLNAAGTLPAGRVYLPKPGGVPAPAILTIDWDATTGINNAQLSTSDAQLSGNWYSLEGIKLNGRPTKKGLYLRDGKKIIVR